MKLSYRSSKLLNNLRRRVAKVIESEFNSNSLTCLVPLVQAIDDNSHPKIVLVIIEDIVHSQHDFNNMSEVNQERLRTMYDMVSESVNFNDAFRFAHTKNWGGTLAERAHLT